MTHELGARKFGGACKAWSSVVFIALIALASGCAGGTETGNPSFTATLSYTGYSSDPSAIALRAAGSVAAVESAWFELDRIVSAASSCGTGAEAPFVVSALGLGDHAAGKHNSISFRTSPGDFCGIDVPFKRVADAMGAPDALAGQGLLMTGKLADGTPFTIVSGATPVIRLQATSDGFSLNEGERDLLLGFDFATWLSGVDFSSAERGGDAILISEGSNPALLESFEAALAAGLRLYRDRDGDGVLDTNPEELARVR